MYDVIVIGGGHAGLEAACIAAKMGAKTHLITTLIQNIALASCNPAIGGLGKGHLVKEVDALGGVMGKISDKCGLQYRTLNASKGPAVRGSRAQIDMDQYSNIAKDIALNTPNLTISQEMTQSLILEKMDSKLIVRGVCTNLKNTYYAKSVIITTGTFLNGLVHIGESKISSGRIGELPSIELSTSLKSIGLEMGRLKTGTCPRVDGRSINKDILEKHHGDINPPHFSYTTKDFEVGDSLPCFVTYTNETTHELIRSNFHRAPLFTGQIQGVGPRYCPSIEDKVNRFADKPRHQLFLEPQNANATEYYINGLSTSLPNDIQIQVVRSIKGLENANITRFGYAIEYDYVYPTELYHTLETKKCQNLFLAGQINGTTGYEEAAAQGIMAGINAVLKSKSLEPFILQRNEGYIAVMIDDLVSKGTKEPYRVFTSRAEYRLLLREDNAIFRLGDYAYKLGLMEEDEYKMLQKDKIDIQNVCEKIFNSSITPSKENLALLEKLDLPKISDKTPLFVIIGQDNLNFDGFEIFLKTFNLGEDISQRAFVQIQIECKYKSYIDKQQEAIENMESMLKTKIDDDFVYDNLPGLSLEVIEKLNKFRPKTLFQAQSISGITPAALEVLQLYIHLRKSKSK